MAELEKTNENKPYWYVVHTYSGYENKVKANIEKSIENLHLEEQILEVQVPMQSVVEVRNGQRKTVQKKLFPSYVLLHMFMNDETWYVVRNTRGVTGFVGPESKPVPLTEAEMNALGINDEKVQIDVKVGETVQVISDAWKDTIGVVRSINPQKATITIGVDMFGRETPIEINAMEIRKL